RLLEVGTTNRTHLADYAEAIGAQTGLILKAHTSNYRIEGFTKSVPAAELARLARAHKLPFVHDLGSGALVSLARFGLRPEPTVREALAEGADLVTFSGDKLLGGPQSGIIAGAKDLVRAIAKNPLKRALRIDKIRLAALAAVLKLYRDPDRLWQTLPTLRAFARARPELTALGNRLAPGVAAAVGADYAVTVEACVSQVGSGALPLDTLPSAALSIKPIARKGAGRRLAALAHALRSLPVPVIGHINDQALILDLRCLEDEAGFLAQLDQIEDHLLGPDQPPVPASRQCDGNRLHSRRAQARARAQTAAPGARGARSDAPIGHGSSARSGGRTRLADQGVQRGRPVCRSLLRWRPIRLDGAANGGAAADRGRGGTMIVGTAGHIDHGKTLLIQKLTGVDTDRLKEEKARGISIDLGFAYWQRPGGATFGFVDVPGHEGLVHNMLAGATGIDFVVLIIAADDGVMPQTREHLTIMDLLGLERGL